MGGIIVNDTSKIIPATKIVDGYEKLGGINDSNFLNLAHSLGNIITKLGGENPISGSFGKQGSIDDENFNLLNGQINKISELVGSGGIKCQTHSSSSLFYERYNISFDSIPYYVDGHTSIYNYSNFFDMTDVNKVLNIYADVVNFDFFLVSHSDYRYIGICIIETYPYNETSFKISTFILGLCFDANGNLSTCSYSYTRTFEIYEYTMLYI